MKRNELQVLSLGLLVNVLLQVITVGRWSVWHDEGFTALLIDYDFSSMLERMARDVHPPLYYILLKGWSVLFGTGDVALRSMSILFTTLGVFATYMLVRRLFSKDAAQWSLLLLATGPFLVRYGQEMRMYPLAMLLIVLATHLFVSLLRGDTRARIWIGYSVLIALALYTQYYAGLILPAHGVHLLYKQGIFSGKKWWRLSKIVSVIKSIDRRWWFSWAGAFVLFAPWIPIALRQAAEIQGSFWIRPVSHESFYSTFTTLLLFHESHSLGGWLSLAGIVSVATVIVLLWKFIGSDARHRASALLLARGIAVPAVVLFVMSLPLQPTYFDRYFAMFANMFYALIGVAVYYMFVSGYWSKAARYFVTVVLVASTVFGLARVALVGDFDGDRTRYTMRHLMEFVELNYDEQEPIIAADLWVYFDARFYNPSDTTVRVHIPYEVNGWGNSSLVYERDDILLDDLEEFGANGQAVWFVDQTVGDSNVPENWIDSGVSLSDGYARVTKYIIN